MISFVYGVDSLSRSPPPGCHRCPAYGRSEAHAGRAWTGARRLEEHLRKLAAKHGVAAEKSDGAPRKADTLNAELAKAGAYNKLEQKSVTAWLDLRNKAAHGAYDEYDHRQVASLIQSARDFMVRHPA